MVLGGGGQVKRVSQAVMGKSGVDRKVRKFSRIET